MEARFGRWTLPEASERLCERPSHGRRFVADRIRGERPHVGGFKPISCFVLMSFHGLRGRIPCSYISLLFFSVFDVLLAKTGDQWL